LLIARRALDQVTRIHLVAIVKLKGAFIPIASVTSGVSFEAG
jgi:hypothetical protein